MGQIYNALATAKGCTFCTITFKGAVKMNKKGNAYFDRVTKVETLTGIQFNYTYSNAVNNRLEKAGEESTEFKGGHLPWGKWEVINKSILHKGERYIRFYLSQSTRREVTYFVDGRLATEQEIAEFAAFIPVRKACDSRTQEEAGLTENQVKPFALKEQDIISVTINGATTTNEPTEIQTAI